MESSGDSVHIITELLKIISKHYHLKTDQNIITKDK
jgi:hypothetical protein